MTITSIFRPWIGLIIGVLIIAITFFLISFKAIPDPVAVIIIFIGAAVVAGYFTPGPVTRGAIAGFVCGLSAESGIIISTILNNPGSRSIQNPSIMLLTVLFYAIIVILPNTVGGIIGNTLRKGLRKMFFTPESESDKLLQRNQLIGIILGVLICVFPMLILGTEMKDGVPELVLRSMFAILLISPLAGGVISGIFSPGEIRTGFYSGLVTGTIAIGIVVTVILVQITQITDNFVAGLGIIVAIAFAIYSFPLAIAGGIIGALIKSRISGRIHI